MERSRPTMPPTKAVTATSSANCCQFCLRPNEIGLGGAVLRANTLCSADFLWR